MKTQEQKAIEILRELANFLGSKDLPNHEQGLVVPRERSVTLTDDMGFGQTSMYVGELPFTHSHFGARLPNQTDEQTFARWVDQFHNLVCGSDYLLKSQELAEEMALEKQAMEQREAGDGI